MFELGIRVAIAAAMTSAALVWKAPQATDLARLGAIFAAYSVFVHLLDRRGMRSRTVSTFVAGADSLLISLALANLGRLESFGFLSLAPIAYAANRFGCPAVQLAPIAAGGLIASHTLVADRPDPTLSLGLQAAAILTLGLMLNAKVSVVKVLEPVLPTRTDDLDGVPPEENLELRESYRRLKDSFQHMEKQAARDRRRLAIRECRRYEGKRFLDELSKTLMDESGADGICLFGVDLFTQRLCAIKWKGATPNRVVETSITAGAKKPAKRLALELHEAIGATSEMRHAATILRCKGRVIGAIVLTHESMEKLEASLEVIEELADAVAEMIVENLEIQTAKRRMREAEMLYDFSTGLSGAKTPATLAGRAVRELADCRQLDSVSIWLIDEGAPMLLAQEGDPNRFFDGCSFAAGPGFDGWRAMGSPEIGVFDAYEDSRCGPKVAREYGVGSFALAPIQFGSEPYALLVATTKRTGGVDAEAFDAIRRTADELAHRIAHIEGCDLEEGLATATEIKNAMAECEQGCLVYLEPQRRSHWTDLVGQPAFDLAIREFGRRLKPRLPSGALAVRRPQDDFVVLLRGVSVEFATSWANEAAALASFVGLRIPGEDRRMPLGMRAKVAEIGTQIREISPERAEVA